MFKIFELNSKLWLESFSKSTCIQLSEHGKSYSDLESVLLDLKILDSIKQNNEKFKIFKV